MLSCFFALDAVHVIVQPTRQIETSKMVRGPSRQTKEENNKRADNYDIS